MHLVPAPAVRHMAGDISFLPSVDNFLCPNLTDASPRHQEREAFLCYCRPVFSSFSSLGRPSITNHRTTSSSRSEISCLWTDRQLQEKVRQAVSVLKIMPPGTKPDVLRN